MLYISAFLRPIRSPRLPKNQPPSGRATKPTACVISAAIRPATGSDDGKNAVLNTSTAQTAKMAKSYHSTMVPMLLAMSRRTRAAVATGRAACGPG